MSKRADVGSVFQKNGRKGLLGYLDQRYARTLTRDVRVEWIGSTIRRRVTEFELLAGATEREKAEHARLIGRARLKIEGKI
jgi:hypothetical protein